jgi:hypothetical protein
MNMSAHHGCLQTPNVTLWDAHWKRHIGSDLKILLQQTVFKDLQPLLIPFCVDTAMCCLATGHSEMCHCAISSLHEHNRVHLPKPSWCSHYTPRLPGTHTHTHTHTSLASEGHDEQNNTRLNPVQEKIMQGRDWETQYIWGCCHCHNTDCFTGNTF